jgi:hypothetical protein
MKIYKKIKLNILKIKHNSSYTDEGNFKMKEEM